MVSYEALGLGTMGLVGIGMFLFGTLMAFAAGMSTNSADESGKGGCLIAVIGLVLLVVSIVMALVKAFT